MSYPTWRETGLRPSKGTNPFAAEPRCATRGAAAGIRHAIVKPSAERAEVAREVAVRKQVVGLTPNGDSKHYSQLKYDSVVLSLITIPLASIRGFA